MDTQNFGPKKEVRLLLLGKTNYENRTVKNILTKQIGSVDELLEEPKTTEVNLLKHNLKMIVTDTPGLQDSDISAAEVKNKIEYVLKGSKYREGFHAVLLIYRFPVRWTPEEVKTFQMMEDIIGRKNIRNNGVIVMTNGAALCHSHSNETKVGFENYIKSELEGPGFGSALSSVNKEVYFLDYDCEEDVFKSQKQELIKSVLKRESFSLYEDSVVPIYSTLIYLSGLINGTLVAVPYLGPIYALSGIYLWSIVNYVPGRNLVAVPYLGPYLCRFWSYVSGRRHYLATEETIDEESYDMLPEIIHEESNVLNMSDGGQRELTESLQDIDERIKCYDSGQKEFSISLGEIGQDKDHSD